MSVSLIDGHIDDDVMTDEQIIKALEHCVTDLDCLQCPYVDYDGKECCDEKLLNDLCDLINRQKAEVERLKEEIAILDSKNSVKDKLLAKAESKMEAMQMDKEQLESDVINANMNCEHLQAELERLKKLRKRNGGC